MNYSIDANLIENNINLRNLEINHDEEILINGYYENIQISDSEDFKVNFFQINNSITTESVMFEIKLLNYTETG